MGSMVPVAHFASLGGLAQRTAFLHNMASSAICTLFEGHYHCGVAALVNSLYTHGFRGSVYAGYRGELPAWCEPAASNEALPWPGARTLAVAAGLHLHLLPLAVTGHLTNHKPDFMLQLWAGPAREAPGMVYFDPDIVVKCNWAFYERWLTHGVALVHEIIANDMPPTHPVRHEWEQVIRHLNEQVVRELHSFINGGFCGVARRDMAFLEVWAAVMRAARDHYREDMTSFIPGDRTHLFHGVDQDALNIAAMCSAVPISEVGPDGMDFTGGGWLMSHAVGAPKPWKKRFVRAALQGNPPTLAERAFWKYAYSPIACFSPSQNRFTEYTLLLAAFIGRFYRRH